jgi:hypothetical protein
MAKKNKYVDFVSDEHFLACVKWVCDSYPDKSGEVDMVALQRNTIDPFKMVFDIVNGELSVDGWIHNETIRQADKTINNRIGDFHQKLLGGVKGWTDLGVGDESKVDLKRNDDSIFIELKNKFNTVNSDSLSKVRDKLEKAVSAHPKATAFWAYIIERDGSSGESQWIYLGRNNPKIKKVWGSNVYELVTGDKQALEKVWKVLPIAIAEVIGSKQDISSEDMKKLVEFFKSAFQN